MAMQSDMNNGAPDTAADKAPAKRGLRDFIFSMSRLLALFLVCVAITIVNPNFSKATNLINILRQATPQLIVALGMTVVLLTGGIDLSVGSTMTFASVVAGYFLTQAKWLPWYGAALMGLASGAAVGFLNGVSDRQDQACASDCHVWNALDWTRPFFCPHGDQAFLWLS